jgi:hypothetical protein
MRWRNKMEKEEAKALKQSRRKRAYDNVYALRYLAFHVGDEAMRHVTTATI